MTCLAHLQLACPMACAERHPPVTSCVSFLAAHDQCKLSSRACFHLHWKQLGPESVFGCISKLACVVGFLGCRCSTVFLANVQGTRSRSGVARLSQVIDRILFKLDELVRPFVHKILVVIEPLLIDEDYYARVEGREIIANLSKAAGLATMIAAMRPDIDNIDE